ncbi:hypothetical protein [Microbacterium sp.]|uniref:hypothetical protein n=1 Tax=Microbacterium sp. TaxID=51671 RepID=UPI003A91F2C5
MDFAATKAKLLSRAQLVTTGRDAERLRRAVAQKTLRRVHVGWYVLAEHWDAAYPEEQQLMRVIAAADRLLFRGSALVLGSAAVMHGLPLWNVDLAKVHIAGSHTDGSSATPGNVARHRVDIPVDDLTMIHGIPCTTLDRTVYDLSRTQPLEAAVAVADAALRSIAWSDDTHTYDEDAAARWKARMMTRFAQARGARGVRQGEWVIAFADGRADRPGESVSRLQLRRLGFRPPELQVRVPGPNGRDYFVDFFIVDADAWGEMDGKTKYHQLLLTRGATPREIFDAEKAREDWIRGTTQRKMARWGMEHISTPEKLGARLKRFGIVPGDA